MEFKVGDRVIVIKKVEDGFEVGTIGTVTRECRCLAAALKWILASELTYGVTTGNEKGCQPDYSIKKLDGDADPNVVTTWDDVPYGDKITKRREVETV